MFENFRKSMRARIAPTGDHISELRQDLNARLQDFRAQRTPAEQARLEQDFAQVLHAWGIEKPCCALTPLAALSLWPEQARQGGSHDALSAFTLFAVAVPEPHGLCRHQ